MTEKNKDKTVSKVEENRNLGGRPKGYGKTGGRKKGTPNKRTADITERLEGEDIVGSLLHIAKTTDDEALRASIYKDLMQYFKIKKQIGVIR